MGWDSAVLGGLVVAYALVAWLTSGAIAAVVAGTLVVVLVLGLRWRGSADSALERLALAWFLAMMPTAYVFEWTMAAEHDGWGLVEWLGLLAFTAMALLGMRGSRWWLAVGIGAHGLWDGGHIGRAEFMVGWYPWVCMAADLVISGVLVWDLLRRRR